LKIFCPSSFGTRLGTPAARLRPYYDCQHRRWNRCAFVLIGALVSLRSLSTGCLEPGICFQLCFRDFVIAGRGALYLYPLPFLRSFRFPTPASLPFLTILDSIEFLDRSSRSHPPWRYLRLLERRTVCAHFAVEAANLSATLVHVPHTTLSLYRVGPVRGERQPTPRPMARRPIYQFAWPLDTGHKQPGAAGGIFSLRRWVPLFRSPGSRLPSRPRCGVARRTPQKVPQQQHRCETSTPEPVGRVATLAEHVRPSHSRMKHPARRAHDDEPEPRRHE